MAAATRPLGQIFTDWPDDVADTLAELASYDYQSLRGTLTDKNVDEELAELIFDLRRHALEIKNSSDREVPLSSPEAVAGALGVTLSPPPGRWITYPLDASRRRISAAHKTSGSRFLCLVSTKVPTIEELTPLPEGGTYLLVRKDSPEVLDIPGVIERIENLSRHSSLADVIFYVPGESANQASAVYSLRRGQGARGREELPLDVSEHVSKKVRNLWQ